MEKQQEEDPGKTNAEAEVQSMVSVPIHQDTSSVPPMTTPTIDLTLSQSGAPLPTSTTTTLAVTTTTIPPPPTQPQQSSADQTLLQCIDELEQHMASLFQHNLALEESKAVDEIVTYAVDSAMQAPLQAHFGNLPTVDMKEILQQQMFENPEEARQKKRKRRDVPRTPFGLPPPQPPPPPPPAGVSGAPGSEALSSSKSAALAPYSMAWTKSDTRYESASERPLTPEPAWTIPSAIVSDVENNWATTSHMQILSVVKIKAYSRYGYDYLSKIVLRRANLQEHTIAEKDFKNLHPNEFQDLNLLLLQGHLDYLPGYEFKHDYTIIESPRAVVFSVNNTKRKIMRFNKIYKFSDGTLTRILEALAYRVKEFKIKRLNPGMNTCFWTQKDVTRSKELIAATER
nr:hypothetical protein [Tanacetum cinerariifolium]